MKTQCEREELKLIGVELIYIKKVSSSQLTMLLPLWQNLLDEVACDHFIEALLFVFDGMDSEVFEVHITLVIPEELHFIP